MLARMLVSMYGLKANGLFYKSGLKTSSSHDRHHNWAKYSPSHNILQNKVPLRFSKKKWVKTTKLWWRGCLYMYAHKDRGRF